MSEASAGFDTRRRKSNITTEGCSCSGVTDRHTRGSEWPFLSSFREKRLLNILAYQNTGQRCGYYPDRDANSNEKQNVRDGHYAIWGPMHFLTRIDSNGIAVKRAGAEVKINAELRRTLKEKR